MSTWYLAGRFEAGEDYIGDFAVELEDRGHTVLEPWFRKGRLPRPYLDHPASSAPAADAMIRAAYDCQTMVLFPTDDILGAATEFGAALASTVNYLAKRIIVVNPFEVRQSVFYAHPAVIAVRGLQEIRQMDTY